MGTGGSPFNALQASYHPVMENKQTNTHPSQCDILNCFIVLFIEASGGGKGHLRGCSQSSHWTREQQQLQSQAHQPNKGSSFQRFIPV